MITVLVQFRLASPVDAEDAQALFLESAPRYRGLDGLQRKYYLVSDDGLTVGGVYLWRDRATAERFHADDWQRRLADKYGTAPMIHYFQTPVVVDNVVDGIFSD